MKIAFVKNLHLAILLTLSSSCATIVLDKYQSVLLTNTPPGGSLNFPIGETIYLREGTSPISFMRSRRNVPVVFICGDHAQVHILRTSPNLWFLLGNIFSFDILGWLVDGLGKYGWDYDDLIVFPQELRDKCIYKPPTKNNVPKPPSSFRDKILDQVQQ